MFRFHMLQVPLFITYCNKAKRLNRTFPRRRHLGSYIPKKNVSIQNTHFPNIYYHISSQDGNRRGCLKSSSSSSSPPPPPPPSSSSSMALQPGVDLGLHSNPPPNLSIPCSISPFVYSHLPQVRRHVIQPSSRQVSVVKF
jgi:hypothetical protein